MKKYVAMKNLWKKYTKDVLEENTLAVINHISMNNTTIHDYSKNRGT